MLISSNMSRVIARARTVLVTLCPADEPVEGLSWNLFAKLSSTRMRSPSARLRLPVFLALAVGVTACSTDSASGAPTTGATSLGPATTGGATPTGSSTGPSSEASTGTPPSESSETGTVPTTSGTTGDPFGDTSTGEPVPPPFEPGHVFVVGFNDRQVFEYDAALQPVTSWTHPSFDAAEGPSGMVFDVRGHLVVASYDQFCVFSGSGEIETCHPKIQAQRTENIIFDIARNLYTTTSTGGTDEIHKYDENYNHVTTFTLPTGNLTGITCDPEGDLFVASQTGAVSTIYKVAESDLAVLDTFTVPGNAEGLQFAPDGSLLVALAAGVGISRVVASSPSSVLSTISDPGLFWPVPLTIDAAGNLYTGDFEDGTGSAASDLFIFDAAGAIVAERRPSELRGPFGMVVAGVSLPCGAVPPS